MPTCFMVISYLTSLCLILVTLIMIMIVSCTPSCLHRCHLPLSLLGVPTTPMRSAPECRYPCWPHRGVYHSPAWQPDKTNGARLISTRCNNGLPTSPGPLTHMKPVGLALPPLTRLPLTVKPSMRVPSSTWVEPTKICMGYWLKWAPTSYPPKLVIFF